MTLPFFSTYIKIMMEDREDRESSNALKLLRNEQRAKAFKECQDNAWHSIRNVRTETMSILSPDSTKRLNPLIKPGCTVRIWSCEALPHNFLEKLIRTGACESSISYHLAVEIVPIKRTAAKDVSFSIGFMNQPAEKQKLLLHMMENIYGVFRTPDTELNDRLARQYDKKHAQFLYLVAVGELTQEHIDKLQKIIEQGRAIRFPYSKQDSIFSPVYKTYRELSGLRSDTHNCTTFVLDVFGDLVACRGSYFVANPAWCRSHNLSEENFPGCDDRGLVLHEDEVLHKLHGKKPLASKFRLARGVRERLKAPTTSRTLPASHLKTRSK